MTSETKTKTSDRAQDFFNNMDNSELRLPFSTKFGNEPKLCIWCGYPFLIRFRRYEYDGETGKSRLGVGVQVPNLSPTKEHLYDYRKVGRELSEARSNVVWAHARCNHSRAHSEWLPYYMRGPLVWKQYVTRLQIVSEFINLASHSHKSHTWTMAEGIDSFLRAAIMERKTAREKDGTLRYPKS